MRVLSLGAGVQSSTLALMAAEGEIEWPDVAIFADTCAEPKPVYDWLDWLTPRLPFPVVRVQQGDGLTAALTAGRFASPPFYTESKRGEGQLRRQCTREYKLQPIQREVRRLLGLRPRQRAPRGAVEMWVGISLDEVMRMKDSREPWITNRWPLIERRMTRADCLSWMESHGYPKPPKSSCTFCPYHDNRYWRWLRDSDPAGWQQAVEMDRLIRGGVRGTKERLYLHRSLKPLEDVDLSTEQERGQLDLFVEECSGVCFV
jgi:hypothetical protein